MLTHVTHKGENVVTPLEKAILTLLKGHVCQYIYNSTRINTFYLICVIQTKTVVLKQQVVILLASEFC